MKLRRAASAVAAIVLSAGLLSAFQGVSLSPVASATASSDPATDNGQFVPLQARLLDTRPSSQTGELTAALPANTWKMLTVGGNLGVPSSGVSAVALTLTTTGPAQGGYVSLAAGDDPEPSPALSSLFYTAGTLQTNSATVKLGADGKIQVRSTSHTHIVIDVAGYYTIGSGGSGYIPITPQRLVDTRTTFGGPAQKVAPTATRRVQATGNAGIPTGATSVAVNFTVVSPSQVGSLLIYAPAGAPPPNAASLVYPGALLTAIGATVPLDSTGAFSIRTSQGQTDLLVDVVGYFISDPSAGSYTSAAGRVLDTRHAPSVAIPGNGTLQVTMAGRNTIPLDAVSAVGLNLTVIAGANAAGFINMWPSNVAEPGTGVLVYGPSSILSNQVIVGLSPAGAATIANHGSQPVHVVLDSQGYYSSEDVTIRIGVEFDDGSAVSQDIETGQTVFDDATNGTSGEAVDAFNAGIIDFSLNGHAPNDPVDSSGLPAGADSGDGPQATADPSGEPLEDQSGLAEDEYQPSDSRPESNTGTLNRAAGTPTPLGYRLYGSGRRDAYNYLSARKPLYLERCSRSGCARTHKVEVQFRQNLRYGSNSKWDITTYSYSSGLIYYESEWDYYCGVNIRGGRDMLCTADGDIAVPAAYNLYLWDGYGNASRRKTYNFGQGNRTYIGKFPMVKIEINWPEYGPNAWVLTRFRGWDSNYKSSINKWQLNTVTDTGA